MTLSVATFRTVFPELADPAAVPDALVQFNLDLATNSLPAEVWGGRLDAGTGFYAAHYIALALQRATAVAHGASPGMAGAATGVVTSKAVGGVSKSMDVRLGTTEGGGSFNLTQYGQSLLTLASTVAASAMQF